MAACRACVLAYLVPPRSEPSFESMDLCTTDTNSPSYEGATLNKGNRIPSSAQP